MNTHIFGFGLFAATAVAVASLPPWAPVVLIVAINSWVAGRSIVAGL